MNTIVQTLNAFLEDTCVIIVVAYLLARGPMLGVLFDRRMTARRQVIVGAVFGLIGVSDVILPGARYPYSVSTLIVTFAAVMAGVRPALVASVLIGSFALILQGPFVAARSLGANCLSAVISAGIGRFIRPRRSARCAVIAGACSQAAMVALMALTSRSFQASIGSVRALFSIPANGLGMALLLLVVTDAQTRSESERHKMEAEQAQALIAEAQIRALRARVHPHFLFNALTSIAALCGIAPDKAENVVLRLSQLMRRSLDSNLARPVSLAEEMEYVDGYLEIEQHRFGRRLTVRKDLDPECDSALVPAFAMQTLVENAVNHGVGPKVGPANLCIVSRRSGSRIVLAVLDDGPGIDSEVRDNANRQGTREHGLQILTAQLLLLHGKRARIRLINRSSGGTLAAFAMPASAVPRVSKEITEREDLDRG